MAVANTLRAAVANSLRVDVGLALYAPMSLRAPPPSSNGCTTSTRSGGREGLLVAKPLEPKAQVVLRVSEWWFVNFDLSLRHYRTPHTSPMTMAKLMASQRHPASNFSSPPSALSAHAHLPCIDASHARAHAQSPPRMPCMFWFWFMFQRMHDRL